MSNINMLKYLFNNSYINLQNINFNDEELLEIVRLNPKNIKYLVKNDKLDPNLKTVDNGNTILIASCNEGLIEIVKYLINDLKVDSNQANNRGNTPLLTSASQGHLPILKYLINECEVDPD